MSDTRPDEPRNGATMRRGDGTRSRGRRPRSAADRDRQTWRHALYELRWGLELGALLGALPLLAASTPRGDAHRVLVYPGFLGDDASTIGLRGLLRARGFDARGWGLGRNVGPRGDLVERMLERLDRAYARSGRRVSLVGWSLGGVYARELARARPEAVRAVVTLASPFQQGARRGALWPIVDPETRARIEALEAGLFAARSEPPPVPSTAIFSASDGIVPPLWCRERAGAQAENVEVPASHLGIGFNPLALYVVAERLAQAEGAWRRFEASGPWRLLFRAGEPHPGETARAQPA